MTDWAESCAREGACRDMEELRRDFDGFRQATDRRFSEDRAKFAVINTKLNWLIAILGAIGAAVLSAVLELAARA